MEQPAFKKPYKMVTKGSHSLNENSLRLTVKISYFKRKIVPRGQSSVLGPRLGKLLIIVSVPVESNLRFFLTLSHNSDFSPIYLSF